MTPQELIERNRRYIQENKLTPGECRFKDCRASIYWVKQESGAFMPCNADGTAHFRDCPGANKFRKQSRKGEPNTGDRGVNNG